MPMPREDDDEELFHDVDDVEFADEEAKEEEPVKKKTAKKAAPKKTATKKAVKKKTAKKKAKRVAITAEEDAPKPTPRKRKKKVVKAAKPTEEAFGAGLFDKEADESPKEAPAAAEPSQEPVEKPEEGESKSPSRRKRSGRKAKAQAPTPLTEETAADEPRDESPAEETTDGEKTDEYGRPEPVANYVVHLYEFGRLKRTLGRDFTPEMAEAFATEFCRTSKRYGRQAVAGKKDTQPAKELDGVQDLLNRESAPSGK